MRPDGRRHIVDVHAWNRICRILKIRQQVIRSSAWESFDARIFYDRLVELDQRNVHQRHSPTIVHARISARRGSRIARRDCAVEGHVVHLVSTGEKRGRPSRSITTETLTKTVDQLDQHYKCYVCNLGIRPDTRRMVFASRTGSRDIVHDSYLCISERVSQAVRRDNGEG